MRLTILALGACLACAAGAHAAELRRVSVEATGTQVEAVFVFKGESHYKLLRLQDPERIVLDFDRTTLARGARIERSDNLISNIRTGKRPNGALRVVLDLARNARACAAWDASARDPSLVLALGSRPSCKARTARQSDGEPALPSTPVAAVVAVHAPRSDGRPIVIAVDAGHGGEDPGAIGRGGTREKDVTLAIARALAARINAAPGMRAVLTRDSDRFIALRDRIIRARRAQADLFVSVHADSIGNREVSGSSVYVLSERGATNEAARWLAERENAADLKGGVKLDDKDNMLASVLLDLSQTANISASMVAAQRVIRSLDQVGEVRKPRVQQAGFVVLKSPDIPSMLVETAYISNPSEERRLRTGKQQRALAEAIFSGISSYFSDNPPPGTLLAQTP